MKTLNLSFESVVSAISPHRPEEDNYARPGLGGKEKWVLKSALVEVNSAVWVSRYPARLRAG